jgi:hypothetical protein
VLPFGSKESSDKVDRTERGDNRHTTQKEQCSDYL